MTYTGGASFGTGRGAMVRWFREQQPHVRSFYELGVGKGAFGEQIRKSFPGARIVGCDVYGPSVDALNARALQPYDYVVFADMADFVTHVRRGGEGAAPEVFVLGDVLEHVTSEQARTLLGDMRLSSARYVLLAIPVGVWPQGPKKQNPSEEHLYTFYPRDLRTWGGWRVAWARVQSRLSAGRVFLDAADHPEYAAQSEYVGNFVLEAV